MRLRSIGIGINIGEVLSKPVTRFHDIYNKVYQILNINTLQTILIGTLYLSSSRIVNYSNHKKNKIFIYLHVSKVS